MPGVTLDAAGLIAVDRDDRRMIVLLARARETAATIVVPASALAQAIRRPEHQARLARLLRQPTTSVQPLDRVDATHVGRLLAVTRTSDVVDAHVVVCARRAGQRVVTSDGEDLRRLDPTIQLVEL
ncbi:MAG TPA: PIN domain-containing protein [Acidimicrobiales bacterium]|nr:PIN domain-containing protein [Acidimicrobiales bacterium]